MHRPERFPIVFNHCMWVAFSYAAEICEDEEEAKQIMDNFYDALLDSVEELGL